jgi:hypothetical protein
VLERLHPFVVVTLLLLRLHDPARPSLDSRVGLLEAENKELHKLLDSASEAILAMPDISSR